VLTSITAPTATFAISLCIYDDVSKKQGTLPTLARFVTGHIADLKLLTDNAMTQQPHIGLESEFHVAHGARIFCSQKYTKL
jgi:hypothetical protein